jgi:hypothetical protein
MSETGRAAPALTAVHHHIYVQTPTTTDTKTAL